MSQRPTQTSLGRRATFRVGSKLPARALALSGGVLMGIVFAMFAAGGMGLTAAGVFVLGALLLIGLSMLPSTIEVGADGILLLQRWSKRRFIPIAIVEHVSPTGPRGIRLRYYNGAEEVIETGPADMLDGVDHVREQIYAEILDAMAAWNANDSSANAAARVARGNRTTREWAELLKGMRGGGGDYRSSEMRDEDLWLVLESAAHPEESRAAAAVILRERGDVARARIRVAAQASASPRLRVALEVASDAKPHEDEEILAALDEQPAKSKRMAKRQP